MPPARPARLRPRKKPSQSRSRATVEALLEATARVLVARGWAGTTTNHVARRAGVSVGTLYEYFPGKEALVAALVDQHLLAAEARLAALAAELAPRAASGGLTLTELVPALVGTMLALHAQSPRLHRVLFEEVPHPPASRARVRALEDRHAAALAALLPHVPDAHVAEPDVAARLVVELLEALTHRWLVGQGCEPLPLGRMQAELERLLFAYLRAGAAAAPRPAGSCSTS